ncbi:XRE family transcriptional regulator [Paracoccus aestuariivivens]|uniref:Helix-turn-helix domain-containing protein n=1 Tax=Paracoccus aestuariivivens TaxID=1820333 RepID=A0A6L6JDT8_9RHOB|nr:helix-turn-helix domain-containing protein [Paracoccus aestuariivivens]
MHESGMRLRLGQILTEKGIKQRQLAEMLDVSNGYVSQLVSGKRQPSPELLLQLSQALGVTPTHLMEPSRPVAVAGRVGAGNTVELVDSYAKGGGLFYVAAPEDLSPSGIVAVEVRGDSMSPLIEEGDIIFFSRYFHGIDEDVVGHVGICGTEDGRAMVKQIKFGRDTGTFDLFSVNPNHPPEYGVKLAWAAPWRRIIRKRDVELIEI